MTDILVILLLVALLFMTLLWPINRLARLFQAERSGYGPVAVAIGSSLVIGLLIQIFLSTLVDWPIILAANFVIDAAIFTLLLGTSITAGIIITVIENLLGSVLMVVSIIALSAMGVGGVLITDSMMLISGGGDVQKSGIESYANAVCDCGQDETCLHDRFAELVFMTSQAEDQGPGSEAQKQTLRARLCVNSGSRKRRQADSKAYVTDIVPPSTISNEAEHNTNAVAALRPPPTLTLPAATLPPQQASTTPVGAAVAPPTTPPAPVVTAVPAATPVAPATTPAPAPITGPPPISIAQPRRARWTYTKAPLANIDNYVNKPVRIARKDNGRIVSGTLSRSNRSNAIALEQQRYGGVFVMYIPKAQIRTLEIRTLTAR